MALRGRASPRDPSPFLPLTPAAFHVLLALAEGPKHGYLILKDVEERTAGDVRLSTGTLYGLIKRFLDDELIVEMTPAEGGDERRRPYKLTPSGREVAAAEAQRLEIFATPEPTPGCGAEVRPWRSGCALCGMSPRWRRGSIWSHCNKTCRMPSAH